MVAIGASLTPRHAASINGMRPCDAYAHRAMPMRNSDVEYKDGLFCSWLEAAWLAVGAGCGGAPGAASRSRRAKRR